MISEEMETECVEESEDNNDLELMGMDEMVPVYVKTDILAFQEQLGEDNSMLASKDLKFLEFLEMLVEKDPTDFVIIGTDGHILDQDSTIESYMSTFQGSMHAYPISIIEKKLDLIDEPTMTVNTTESLRQLKPSGKKTRVRRRKSPKRKIVKRDIMVADEENSVTVPIIVAEKSKVKRTRKPKGNQKKPKALQNTQSSSEIFSSSLLESNFDTVPKTKTESPVKDSHQVKSDSDEDYQQMLLQNKNFSNDDLKPKVLNFTQSKVSNRNMLRVRQELMKLKNAEDYFKLTSLAPLTAGLLEQMFCRSFPSHT